MTNAQYLFRMGAEPPQMSPVQSEIKTYVKHVFRSNPSPSPPQYQM